MNKKIILIVICLFANSCGFQPLYKNININKINIQKIIYSGDNSLVYLIKSYLNLNETNKPNGFKINLSINENISSSNKNTSGITIEEKILISVKMQIYDSKDELIAEEIFTSSNNLQISNNTSADQELKNIKRTNLTQNLAQKIKFKIQLLTKLQ